MKQKDILLIVVIAIVSGVFAFVVANFFFGDDKAYKLTAPTVQAISTEFTLPSQQIFNKDALNPTKDITIGDSANSSPFKTQ